ncbi:MAG TPA: hypothetical protein PK913_10055, partial [Phenylobacterium sp.]|nr:hypothetical protein [Phenylobacterium sp.]
MRRTLPLMLVLLTAGAAHAADPGADPRADRGTMQQKDTFRDAALAPLEDLNLKQQGVPDVLARARSNPYDLTGLDRCE